MAPTETPTPTAGKPSTDPGTGWTTPTGPATLTIVTTRLTQTDAQTILNNAVVLVRAHSGSVTSATIS